MIKNITWKPKLPSIVEDSNQKSSSPVVLHAKTLMLDQSKNEATEQSNRFYTIEQTAALEKAYDEQTKLTK